jgi:capsid protein
MGFLSDLVRAMTVPSAMARPRPLAMRARYDAATVDTHNQRHFMMADSLSAREANNPAVRQRLRDFTRYEVANNCYARGMVDTLADVEVGYGAHLHLPRPMNASRELSQAIKQIETEFENWASAVGLWEKLHTARKAKAQDGEAVGLIRPAPVADSMIELDVQLIEAEQLSHGWEKDTFSPGEVDGIEVDNLGRVTRYFVLPEHPGDAANSLAAAPQEFRPAEVFHWFKCDRPGQLRGIPELTPALPLFSQLRRYTLAVLTAAETAADFAGVVKSNVVPDFDPSEDPAMAGDTVDALPTYDIHRGMFLELPDGREIQQLKAEQPTTTYDSFKREILSEVGRAMSLPRAIALADASGYNYASGRLDRQAFARHVESANYHCERQVLAKVWAAWWSQAALIPGLFDQDAVAVVSAMRPRWMWRVLGHVDRAKEEAGRTEALNNFTTTLAEECGREGRYWEDVLEQQAAEQRRAAELGLTVGGSPATNTAGMDDDDDEI